MGSLEAQEDLPFLLLSAKAHQDWAFHEVPFSPTESLALTDSLHWPSPSIDISPGLTSDSGSDDLSSVNASPPPILPTSPTTSLPSSYGEQIFETDWRNRADGEVTPWTYDDGGYQRGTTHEETIAAYEVPQLEELEGRRAEEDVSDRVLSTSSFGGHPRFHSRKVACQVCHFAKVRCDGGRPCKRCSRMQLTEHCKNRPTRQNARERRVNDNSDSSTRKRRHLSSETPPSRPSFGERSSSSSPDSSSTVTSSNDFALSAPSSIPPSLRLSLLWRVNESNVSSCLLASHFRVVTLFLRRDGFAFPQAKFPLREKMIQHTWFHENMTPLDREAVAHAFVLHKGGRWYEGYFDTQLRSTFEAVAAKLAAQDYPSTSLPSHSTDSHRRPQCDGRLCSGYCPYVHRLNEETPCSYSWVTSPDTPIPDHPGFPSHAFLCIRQQPEDVGVQERQQRLLSQRAARLAQKLLAEYSESEADVAWVREEVAEAMKPHHDQPPQLHDWLEPLPVGGTSNAASDSDASEPSICVSMTVQVNSAFQQLLGYSQVEVRASFVQSGEKALYGLVKPEHWAELMDLMREAKMMRRTDFRLTCTAVTRTQQEVPCVLSASQRLDEDGKVQAMFLSFTPMPDNTSGARQYESAASPPSLG